MVDGTSLGVRRFGAASSRALARRSEAWADDAREDAAVLTVGVVDDHAAVLGAFQRTSELPVGPRPAVVVRRGSGGGTAAAAPDAIWMQLALARPDALVPCSADKLLNRYVRPLLRALTRATGVPASYFGRDWISMAGHPVSLVAFAHEAATGRSLVEAIVGVRTPFASEPRGSFLGKPPRTLDAVAGHAVDPHTVVDAIVTAYRGAASASHDVEDGSADAIVEETFAEDPAWTAIREEAIGAIGAGVDAGGRLRIGGALMASRDAIARLEARIAALAPGLADAARHEAIGRAVDETLATGGAVTFGVRSLASLRDVVLEALASRRSGPIDQNIA